MEPLYERENRIVNLLNTFEQKEFAFNYFHYKQSNKFIQSDNFKYGKYELYPLEIKNFEQMLNEGTWNKESIIEHYNKLKVTINEELKLYNKLLEHFENEIKQNNSTLNPESKISYYQNLNETINLVCNIDEDILLKTINRWNNENLNNYNNFVQDADEYFKTHVNKNLNHLEEFEITNYRPLLKNPDASTIKTKIINNHYNCIKRLPNMVDLKYFDDYIYILKRLNNKLQIIVEKYNKRLESVIALSKNENQINQTIAIQQTETKTDKLKAELGKYGFFKLPMVKQLSEPNKQSLIELISKNKMPYGIAMFDYLGFCEYLDREQGTKYKTDNILSKLFNENAKDGSSAKHYRRSLIKPTTRYKADEYKEIVKIDYQKLK